MQTSHCSTNVCGLLRVAILRRDCDGDGEYSTEKGESDRPIPRSCRFVLLTSKGATVCLVCATRSTPVERPEYQALASSSSPRVASSSLPPSPLSTPSAGRWTGHLGGKRQPAGSRSGSDLDAGVIDGVAAAGNNSGDSQQFHVYLRRSCRFVNDLVLASITRYIQLPGI